MKVGIVGAGVLGLTLGYRLARLGNEVTILEAGPAPGGLACATDYGPFVWDRFYHCILPTDSQVIELIEEIGLGGDLRWRRTGTGYYARGTFHEMSSTLDQVRFPLLSVADKARLGAAMFYATRFADPWKLYGVTAEEWLTTACGRRGYEVFWRPLLKAKFGAYYDRVAAVFIWATLARLAGARSAATSREKLGYASGGYARILGRLQEMLRSFGASVHLEAKVVGVQPAQSGTGGSASGCDVTYRERGEDRRARFDQVFFTGPTRLAREVAAEEYRPHVDRVARENPTGEAYLGVACLVLVLRRPLTPYYVLNIGDEGVELTGLIEMTNLVDRHAETKSLSLLYLPQYMDSADDRFDLPDDVLADGMMRRGLERLFGAIEAKDVVYRKVHKARLVQPLPLVRPSRDAGPPAGGHRNRTAAEAPALVRPFQVLNTSMLTCATLNNNEVVGLVNRFLDKSAPELRV